MKRKISLTEATFQSVRMTALDDDDDDARNGDDKVELPNGGALGRRRSRRLRLEPR